MQYPQWYISPMTQVVFVGFVCFCTVGMFSAVSNLGAGGSQDVSLADTANGILYGLFSISGLFSGGVSNLLGPRITLAIGTLGYALYVGGLWCHQTQGNDWFFLLASAILGICAALLWSAQGAIMMSYPLEKDKGKAFGLFWAIFQFGSFIGAIIALSININKGGLSAVSTSTYLAFIVIMFVGTASTVLLVPPSKVIRSDGSIVKVQASTTPKQELLNMMHVLKDWRMWALLPMFFASNYFYAYQGALNAFYFNGRTRALNATLEGAGAIVGALLIGFLVLDIPFLPRRTRGFLGLGVVFVVTTAVWIGGIVWQSHFTRESVIVHIDYTDSNYGPKAALYFFYYFGDATYQALAYWIMGAISNDPFTLARFTGLYKCIQSAGGAGSFGMDAVATPFMNEALASWIMMLVSYPLAALVIYHIKETSYTEEKTIFVDESHAAAAEQHFHTGKLEVAGHDTDSVSDEKVPVTEA